MSAHIVDIVTQAVDEQISRRQSHGTGSFHQTKSPPNTPSMRTGPPRTLSYVYSSPNSPASSIKVQESDIFPRAGQVEDASNNETDFRGALEVGSPIGDRKGKRRESKFTEDGWNPMKWFQEPPKDDKPASRPSKLHIDTADVNTPDGESGPFSAFPGGQNTTDSQFRLRRAFSDPHAPNSNVGRKKWGRLRSLIPNVNQSVSATTGRSTAISHSVPLTDELIASGLSALMLRLWFERDEKGQRRIPVLLHRLRIRISDSLHPLHGNKSVFRIECEYANGAARWVIYRSLRDFISLHAHYTVSNAYNRNVDKLPEFPKTSECLVTPFLPF